MTNFLSNVFVFSIIVCAQPLVSILEECKHLSVPITTLEMADVDLLDTRQQADSRTIREASLVHKPLVPANGVE